MIILLPVFDTPSADSQKGSLKSYKVKYSQHGNMAKSETLSDLRKRKPVSRIGLSLSSAPKSAPTMTYQPYLEQLPNDYFSTQVF